MVVLSEVGNTVALADGKTSLCVVDCLSPDTKAVKGETLDWVGEATILSGVNGTLDKCLCKMARGEGSFVFDFCSKVRLWLEPGELVSDS